MLTDFQILDLESKQSQWLTKSCIKKFLQHIDYLKEPKSNRVFKTNHKNRIFQEQYLSDFVKHGCLS